MTAASGGPGESPDYEGHRHSGSKIPADPAYGGWPPSGPPYSPPPAPYPSYPVYPPPYGPSHPGGYGYPWYPAVATRTNVLAIVSLVSSVSGLLCFVGSLAGIITGAIAIGQIKRTGENGYGLALAGTMAGVVGLLVYLVLLAYALS